MFPSAMDRLSDVHSINQCYLIIPAINSPNSGARKKKIMKLLETLNIVFLTDRKGMASVGNTKVYYNRLFTYTVYITQ